METVLLRIGVAMEMLLPRSIIFFILDLNQ
jgi:hypothetical protein